MDNVRWYLGYNQLVYLTQGSIFKPIMCTTNICFFQFKWHASELWIS